MTRSITQSTTKSTTGPMELVCPAGTPASLRAAVDAGADAVYLGFRDATNARNFPGLNFSRDELADGLDYAHAKGAKVLLAINTYPKAGEGEVWKQAVDDGADLGVDAVILADLGLVAYARDTHLKLRRHLSVQASASNADAINFYAREFGLRRVVLPRVLTLDEIARVNQQIDVETEVFVFGGLCVMAEGRCSLSSYVTGVSPNKDGACSPASHVRYDDEGDELVTKLGELTVNRVCGDEPAGYPTLCKGRFHAMGKAQYLFEEPTSLSIIHLLPELADAGVTALKIEGRQRGRAYVAEVVSAFRQGVAAVAEGRKVAVDALERITEGGRQTAGAYEKKWR